MTTVVGLSVLVFTGVVGIVFGVVEPVFVEAVVVGFTTLGVALIVVTETLKIGAPRLTFPDVNFVVRVF